MVRVRLRGAQSLLSLKQLRRYSVLEADRTPDCHNAFIAYRPDTHNPPPLGDGKTVALKDNISTVNFRTTCGSHSLESYQSPYDATIVKLLKAANYAIVGKTNMDEFGMGSHSMNSYFGPVNNIHEGVHFSAGGSSGGSAMAVKAGLCDVAIGTDTGGSVRLPAAWTGCFGFKPSYGLISRWGVVDYANSLDTVGIFAENVNGIASTFDVLSQFDERDPTALRMSTRARIDTAVERANKDLQHRAWRVGVPIEYNIKELSPLVRQAWTAALSHCQEQGCEVVPISLPSTRKALSAYYVLAPAEASSNLAKYDGVRYGTRAPGTDGQGGILFSKTRASGLGDEVKRRILLGSYSLSADAMDNYFIQAQKVRRKVQTEFNDAFNASHALLDSDTSSARPSGDDSGVDVILCPTAPTTPPTHDEVRTQTAVESYTNDVFTVPASLAGLPAISLPWEDSSAETDQGPERNIGIQIIGQFGHDSQVLEFARKLGTTT